MIMRLLLALAFACVGPGIVQAWTGLPDKTLVTVGYTEPATLVDGTAIADLTLICAIATLDGGTESETCWPASVATGGQTLKQVDGLATAVLPGQRKTLSVQNLAVRATGTRSARSAATVLVIDRLAQGPDTQPPPAPASVTAAPPVAGATGVTVLLTFPISLDPPSMAPAPFYDVAGAFNDNTQPFTGSLAYSGSAATATLPLTVPYHASGVATGAWGCLKARDLAGNKSPAGDQACFSTTIPAAPVAQTFTLTVAKAGTGAGTVTGGGSYPAGQSVTPTATPIAGSSFAGWSGACMGGSCAVIVDANKTVTATFTLVPPPNPPAPTATQLCTLRLAAQPPDATGGWTMQLKEQLTPTTTANLGAALATAPYVRDVSGLTLGDHQIFAAWTKTGQAPRTSDVGLRTCR